MPSQLVDNVAPTGKVMKKRISRTKLAGLRFSVSRCERHLRRGRYAQRIGKTSAVFLAAVLEYLTAEVIELAGYCAVDMKSKRISPRSILAGIKGDQEVRWTNVPFAFKGQLIFKFLVGSLTRRCCDS